jgi:uncharacterized membrane protein
MWNYIWPIGLVVLTNIFYNIITKSTPSNTNAFLSLTITYIVAGVCSFAMYLLQGDQKLPAAFEKLNWTSYALGVVIVGLEIGYIYAFRAGWKVNTASLVANITLACVLVVVGFLLYKETLTIRQVIGIFVCIGGLFLITK